MNLALVESPSKDSFGDGRRDSLTALGGLLHFHCRNKARPRAKGLEQMRL